MRKATFVLGAGVLSLAFITAQWSSHAHRTAARNERLEKEISQRARERDRELEAVERLRQPLAVQERVDLLGKPTRTDGSKPNKSKPEANPKNRTPVVAAKGAPKGSVRPADATASRRSEP